MMEIPEYRVKGAKSYIDFFAHGNIFLRHIYVATILKGLIKLLTIH